MLGSAGSAAQLRAIALDKNASCVRIDLMTPWGSQRTTSTTVDKGVTLPRGGRVDIDGASCNTIISHAAPPPEGVEIGPDCRITATRSTLAEITRLSDEVPGCRP